MSLPASAVLRAHRRRRSPADFSFYLTASDFLPSCLACVHRLEGHRGCVNTCSFNPYGNLELTGCDDGCVWLWDIECRPTNPLLMLAPHKTNVFTTNFLTSSSFISGGNDSTVQVITILNDGTARATSYFNHHIRKVHSSFTFDEHTFVTCSDDQTVRLFDTRIGYRNQSVRALAAMTDADLAYSAGRLFRDLRENHLRGQNDGGGSVFPVADSAIDFRSLLIDLRGERRSQLSHIDAHPIDRKQFLTCGTDCAIRLYDLRAIRDGTPRNTGFWLGAHYGGTGQATGAAFDDSGSRIAVTILGGNIHVLDVNQCMALGNTPTAVLPGILSRIAGRASPPIAGQIIELTGHTSIETVKRVGWMGDFVVTGSDDGSIFFYDSHSGEFVNILRGHDSNVNVVTVHREKKLLATSGVDHYALLWEPQGVARVSRSEVQRAVAAARDTELPVICPVM
jgi:WD repeat-containing protein 42A